MVTDLSHLPDDVEALKQALRLSLTHAETAEQRRIDAEQKLLDSAAELAVARAKASEDLALIAAGSPSWSARSMGRARNAPPA